MCATAEVTQNKRRRTTTQHPPECPLGARSVEAPNLHSGRVGPRTEVPLSDWVAAFVAGASGQTASSAPRSTAARRRESLRADSRMRAASCDWLSGHASAAAVRQRSRGPQQTPDQKQRRPQGEIPQGRVGDRTRLTRSDL
jgi:hypothetical protein